MLGVLKGVTDIPAACAAALADGLRAMASDRPIAIACHFDADGLSSAAILVRALERAGRRCTPIIVGKGETPRSEGFAARLAEVQPGGVILCDLGTHAEPLAGDWPTVIIDHHVPTGSPIAGVTISGNGLSPEPTTSLLSWWAAAALGDQADLLWLAALGLIGDMAPEDAFPELAEAQRRWGKTALRDAVSLINAPRRTASADAAPALRLLLAADGPRDIVKGDHTDADLLRQAKAEVRAAMDEARRLPPAVNAEVALIQLDSPCQIHPLVAQQWRGRLRDKIVIAANRGYRQGWVHFAARSASGRDLIAFLAQHRPAGADDRYGNGHVQATGGALRSADWNSFISRLGFPQAQVSA